MKLTEVLYDSVKEIWETYHSHPFVTGIGDGTLPIEKFRFYMLQDYLYLYDYARVFAMGIVKAKETSMIRKFADCVNETLGGEMDIHQDYMERLGITEEEVGRVEKSLANTSYTSYMLDVAARGDELDILVAILSCAWSYAQIGNALYRQNPDAVNHPFYGEWVTGYISEEYQTMNNELLYLVDLFGESISVKRVKELVNIFVNCSRYEKMFWDMAWHMEK